MNTMTQIEIQGSLPVCARLRDARKRCGRHVQTEILVCYDQCIEDIESCDQHGEVLKALKRKKKLDKREDSKKKKR